VRITVRVPATSANLGPGFDCFGLALDLCNEVTADTEGEPGVSWEGEGADELPTDGTDMVSRAIADAASHRGFSLPDHALHGINRIPLERGLGSSAAAAVAGAAIGYVLAGVPAADAAEAGFDVAAVLEGHADNAAAAVSGGFTMVAGRTVRRLEPHPSLLPVVFVPEERLPTSAARDALSPTVSREDAVFNIGHAALVVVALTEGDVDLLLVALHDRLHERVRAAMIPEVASLIDDLRHREVPACLSGAGPSILAFERDGYVVGDPPVGWRAIRPGVRTKGVEVDVES
jgi:homoserine kinase